MPKIDLLPCPFCGSITAPTVMNQNEAQWLDNDIDEEDLSMVVCCATRKHGCGASTGFCDTAEQAAKEWNTRASGWIPCSERLPGRFDSVLLAILSKNGYGELAYYVTIGGMKNGTEFESYTGDICECETVTHWIPLPEPPGGDDNA